VSQAGNGPDRGYCGAFKLHCCI